MLYLKVTFLSLLSLAIFANEKWLYVDEDGGNGGDVISCDENNDQVELLDTYLAKKFWGIDDAFSSGNNNVKPLLTLKKNLNNLNWEKLYIHAGALRDLFVAKTQKLA